MKFVSLVPVSAAFVLLASCADSPPERAAAPEPVSGQADKPAAAAEAPKPERKKGSSEGIGMEEFFALQQSGGALIYDVRVPYFYGIDHIPGALTWPHTHFDAQIESRETEMKKAVEEGKPVVLYCFNFACSEARNVAKKLVRRGYDVRVMTRGIDAWRDAGLPLETPGGAEPETE